MLEAAPCYVHKQFKQTEAVSPSAWVVQTAGHIKSPLLLTGLPPYFIFQHVLFATEKDTW